MLKKGVYFLAVLLVIPGLLGGCSKGKTTQNANDNIPPLPTVTGEDVDAPAWRQIESAISNALLGPGEGKCEWEVWGWLKQERFIWAFCQGGPELNATAASMPLVVRLASDGSVETIHYPQEGTDYTSNVKGLFPPAVQEKIFANEFDLFTAVNHLETRWNYPSMPPAIYSRAGDPLPVNGGPAVQAILAATADQIAEYGRLGQGNIKQVQYLPDGRIIVKGDRGMGLLDLDQGNVIYLYQDLLAGMPGFLSRDGKRLAVAGEQIVDVYDASSQTHQASIDTSEIEGNIFKVEFLADGLTVMVEKRVPNEGFPTGIIVLYRIDDGTLLNTWEIKGNNFVLSPNGWNMTGLYDLSGLEIWSVARGEVMYTLPIVASAASFSGDGQIMAVVGLGKVHLFWVWDGFEIGRLQKNIGTVSGVALSPDGKQVLTWSDGPYPAHLWRVPDFEPVATLDLQGVTTAAFNQDGSSIVLVGDTAIGLYDVGRAELTRIPSDTYNEVIDISFAPDRSFSQDQRLAVAYRPGPEHSVVVNWDLSTKSPIFTQSDYGVSNLIYAYDTLGIAVIANNNSVKVLDAEDGSLVREYDVHSSNLSDLALDATNHLAVSKRFEMRVYRLNDPSDRLGRKIEVTGAWVETLTWSCYLAASTDQARIQVFDETGDTLLQELSIPWYGYETSLAFLPDCSQLMVASNNQVFRWRTSDWQELEPWTLPGYITSLDISQDESLAAVGLSDGSIHLMDSTSGAGLRTVQEHVGRITALEFSPDGRFLASGGSDGLVIIWGVK